MPAHENLSSQFMGVAPQIAAALSSDGGFSFHAPDLHKGRLVTAADKHPEGGVMVSLPGAERALAGGTTVDDVEEYWHDNRTDAAEHYYGAWRDDGTDYHDVSAHHPSFGAAKAAGRPSGQIAGYVLDSTPHPAAGGNLRMHMEGFGRNDADPTHRSTGDPNKLEPAEWSAPGNKRKTGSLRGQKHTLDDVYDTVNRNRAQRARGESVLPKTYGKSAKE